MRSQAQILVLFASEIEQQISVRFSRRIDVRVQSIATVVWIQLFRQVGKLSVVARILKQRNVLRIQTDR